MQRSIAGVLPHRAAASHPAPAHVDPSRAADHLLAQARHLASLAFGTTTTVELHDAAEALQRDCAALAETAPPAAGRRRRERIAGRSEALAVAGDDLAAVVLLRCGPGPEREIGGVDLEKLLTRVSERHAALADALGDEASAAAGRRAA